MSSAAGAFAAPAPAQRGADLGAACDGRLITAVHVVAQLTAFTRVPAPMRGMARAAQWPHTITSTAVVRRFLVLHVGDRCTERKRADSERILRLQPFIASATVSALDDGAGGVLIEVQTTDDISIILGGRSHGWHPYALTLGSGNVAGPGIAVAVHGERGFAYRDGVGLRIADYQAFGRPVIFSMLAQRDPLGGALTLSLGRPFLTDLQLTAWHAGFSDVGSYATFTRANAPVLSLAVDHTLGDVGGVVRLGGVRAHAFVGGLLTRESMNPDAAPVVVTDTGLASDTDTTLRGRFAPYSNIRLNAVLGARFVRFLTVHGFDALTAAQDVAIGTQLGVLAGRSTPQFGVRDNDIFLAGDFYAGFGTTNSFAALRLEGEGRQDRRSGSWDGMVASGRLAWYRKFSPSRLLIVSDEFTGAWRERVPFQLMLGDGQGGVLGYRGSVDAGGQRNVALVEERWSIGHLTRHADVGVAAFFNAGQTWAGGVPFGVNSGLKASAGLGLLAALPGSKRLWRLDVASRLCSDANAGRWTIRLSAIQVHGFWQEPRDIARVRAAAAPSTIFTWP